jgi:hypothetical protein
VITGLSIANKLSLMFGYLRTPHLGDFNVPRSNHCAFATETLFVGVSQHFENTLSRDRRHTDFLHKMAIEIPA